MRDGGVRRARVFIIRGHEAVRVSDCDLFPGYPCIRCVSSAKSPAMTVSRMILQTWRRALIEVAGLSAIPTGRPE